MNIQLDRRRSRARRLILAVMCALSFLAFTTGAGAQAPTPPSAFADPSSLDPGIPTPASIIGHEVGAQAVRYDALVRYLRLLAEESPNVSMTPYGETHEGRALYYLTITSRENRQRLAQIRADNAKLADPRTLENDAEADRIIRDLPGVAWLAYSIHGDELSPCDAAMQVAYQLAAGRDQATRRLRDELVIFIDPLQNPDGRERYLAQLQTLTGKVPSTDYQALQHGGLWSAGRGNHYLFDMNRDWMTLTQPETRGRVAAIAPWNPHLLVDAHEMSGLDTYLFDPPREPINSNLSPRLMRWRRAMSADQAAAFDRFGWSYYTQEWYEEWYPGYTNAWASLRGAIGLLYEAAGVNGAAVMQEAGRPRTYLQSVQQNVVSSFANLETLRANREGILRDFYEDRREAVTGDDVDGFGRVFLLPPGTDAARRARFLAALDAHGLERIQASSPVEARRVQGQRGASVESMTLPAGTVVVPLAQPLQRLLLAMLEFDPRMTDEFLKEERTELERRRGSRLYDVTAWSIPMAYGLEAYWADEIQPAADAPAADAAPEPAAPTYGFLLDVRSSDVYPALVRLFENGCTLRVATKPFRANGSDFVRGTVLLRRHENPDDLDQIVAIATRDLDVSVRPMGTALNETGPDLGGRRFGLLHPPRVALASQWPTSSTSFGSIWHLLDARLGLRISPVNLQGLGFIDLRLYNVIIIPSAGRLGAVLDDGARRRLKSWVEDGGTLIAVGGAAAALASESMGLSSVRRKRDVLDKLDEYAEYVQRETEARTIDVDPAAVWGDEPPAEEQDEDDEQPANADAPDAAPDEPDDAAKPPPKLDSDARKRLDEFQRIFSPQGVLLDAHADPEHWLCYGVGAKRLPVLVGGSTAYMSKPPAQTALRLAVAEDLRLSGLLWPEARERWGETAWCTREPLGRGQVILFANDPIFRGYFEGTGRVLENAILLGPGLGTSQPLPW
ncbi:MAG: M14 family metallopeptidase [Planctomycetota bacterium]|jgi:hypothetical protein